MNTQRFVCGNESNATIIPPNSNLGRKEAEEQTQTQTVNQPEEAKVKEKDCFTTYPNPSQGLIHISSSCTESYEIQIFNSSGSLIHTYLEDKQEITLPILSKGFFILQIISSNNVFIRKIIVY